MSDVLLIAASFFGYSREIKARLETRGHSVLWFEDRPAIDARTKTLIRLAPALVKGEVDAYVAQIIEQAQQRDIRTVLIIKGEALTPASISRLRAALPRARFILYFWDSYRNMPADSAAKVDLFDHALTFDQVDAVADPRLAYRPLFYLNEYATLPTDGQDIDVLFIGTAHTDRYAVLSRLARALPPELRFEKVLFFPSRWMWRARKLFDGSYRHARRDEFLFTPLNKQEVMALIRRARIVVDIERPIQTGLTMRTLEMLGASRKLVTTNIRIQDADFHHPNNQIYVDRTAPVVPVRFLESAWSPVPPEMLDSYSLDGWLSEVLAI